jgi:hypothetical protein
MLRRLLLVVGFMVTVVHPAWAQSMTDPQRAAVLVEARAAAAAGNASAAAAGLERLWADRQTHDVALELGLVETKLGEHRDAAEHLTFGLRVAPADTPPELTQRARDALTVSVSKIGVLKVRVDKNGAVLKLDGAPIGVSPLGADIFVAPGGHYVSCSLEGFAPAELTTDIEPGTTRTLEFSLQPVAAAPAAPAAAAPDPLRNASGERKQVLKARTIVLALGIAGTGAGAILTTVFGVKGANARTRERDLRAEGIRKFGYAPCSTTAGARSQTCSDLARAVDDRAAANRTANVGLAITVGAGLAKLGVLFLWPRDDGEEVETVGLSPGAGESPAGLTLSGTF